MPYSEYRSFTKDHPAPTIDDGATMPAYAWPGGYPIIYIAYNGDDICPDCANNGTFYIKNNGLRCGPDDDPALLLTGLDVYFEGEPRYCTECNTVIESAYGDPDQVEEV